MCTYSEEFRAMLDRLEAEDNEESKLAVADMEEDGCCHWRKRRMKMDQIRALEESFEADNKLEPNRKLKIAEELGLEPRQVAIWFQNRRARCKTKQLEKDYDHLEASYEALKRRFHSLEQERTALLAQFKDLEAKVEARRSAGELVATPDNLPFVSSDGYRRLESQAMSMDDWNILIGEGSSHF
ncbi:hypothetical protein Dimus_012281 [Dionaea muscipula]